MHVPDGFLSVPVAAATSALGALACGVAVRAEQRDPERIPAGILGALAAFLFAAQMVNLPVAPGTSGHLVGATLAVVLVGPWRGLLVMAVVLVLQALLLQDGGVTALGANLLDMGVAAGLAGYALTRLFGGRGPRRLVAGAVAGAFAGTLAAAALTALWLALSGLYPLGAILPAMLVTHTAIGVLEALLTGSILATLVTWRPDLVAALNERGTRRAWGAVAVGTLAIAAAVAAFVVPFASSLPDGLERTAVDLGFAARAREAPAYGALAAAGAGLAGTCAAALAAWGLGRTIGRGHDAQHR